MATAAPPCYGRVRLVKNSARNWNSCRRGIMRLSRFALAAILCGALPRVAHAGEKGPDAVRAEALFDEGRRLMTAGDFTAACPKFASSQALDPAIGTALNLANCYEK